MKSLIKDNHADVKMIGAVIGILVTLIVAVLVFYNVAASIDTSTLDNTVATSRGYTSNTDNYNASKDATNATDDILTQSGTFFTIAPIIAIVVVAVVILSYVGKIGVGS